MLSLEIKELVFNTARYIQGMFNIELAETPSLVGFADLDAAMNFPVKSKARLTSVYCLYLGIHNREWLNVTNHHSARNTEPHNREWLNARNTLNPAF